MSPVPRGGEDSRAAGRGLLPWRPGWEGKWLVDGAGKFFAWRTGDGRTPHHATAAKRLGVSSWLLDGIVNRDGTLEPTAKAPGVDVQAQIDRVRMQAQHQGMRFRPR